MTDLIPDDEGFTELVDPQVPRVDLVDLPANGAPGFLLMKQDAQAGLMDPDLIRELIGKSQPTDDLRETVTMTGSPGAIAKLIHEAAVRTSDSDVAKAMELDDSPDGMDPTVVLAAPDDDEAPGDPNEPGSPAWEAIDAATAQKWTSIAVRLKNALGVLADRELLEAASADADDAYAAWDLQDAQCALDYVIDILAGFAVDEQAEAELCIEAMDSVGKALAGWDTAPLDTIEALSQVAKAGRVLSAANEAAIRTAAEHLQKVLTSLPAAPIEKDSGRPVAKTASEEPTMSQPATIEDTPQGEPPAAAVGKADGEKPAVVVVYDQKGRLIGIVDPTDVTPVANSEADADDMDDPDSGDDTTGADTTQSTDLEPQPADQAGTPADAVPDDADDVTKSHNETDSTELSDMFKSNLLSAVEEVVKTHSASQQDRIAKTGEAVLELAELVETLKGRVGVLEEQPAEPRVFTQGAGPRPQAQHLRGQDQGAAPVDVARARELKKGLYGGPDSHAQNSIANEMQQMAIARLQAIHSGSARQ